MKIAINGNRHQGGHIAQILRLVDHLCQAGAEVVMTDRFHDYLTSMPGVELPAVATVPHDRCPEGVDLAFSIGGDGAFLKTARWLMGSGAPIAGINTGHLGYLAAYSFDREDEIYRGLLQGQCSLSERSVMQVQVTDTVSPAHNNIYYALNELAITRGDTAPMLSIDTYIDHSARITYTGDGLILATPTGSTAYNLSVGGPILAPMLNGWVLSPIAAHSLSVRPLVVCDNSLIELQVRSRGSSYRLLVDGRIISLPLTAALAVSRAPHTVKIVNLPDHTFTQTLRDKLGWGNRG